VLRHIISGLFHGPGLWEKEPIVSVKPRKTEIMLLIFLAP
jgi:hypothetical protein